MKSKATFWKKIGLHDWFLTKEATGVTQQIPTLTPDDVYKYIVQKFNESIAQLSFANRIVFFMNTLFALTRKTITSLWTTKEGSSD